MNWIIPDVFSHEMQHFVTIIQGFVATHVLDVRWKQFQEQLQGEVLGWLINVQVGNVSAGKWY